VSWIVILSVMPLTDERTIPSRKCVISNALTGVRMDECEESAVAVPAVSGGQGWTADFSLRSKWHPSESRLDSV